MGRDATKATGNVWYEARKKAAMYNDNFASRAGAAECLGISEDCLKSAELNLYKSMPVDVAVIMADGYKAPELCNYYCLHECPIGRDKPIAEETTSIERVTLKILKGIKTERLNEMKEKLVEIAEDGVISEDEKGDMEEILSYLDELAKTISELRLLGKKAIGDSGE